MANSNLTRWDPFAGLSGMHSMVDDLFNNFFGGAALPTSVGSMPAMDVYSEGDKQLVAEVQAPGFSKDDIEINVHDNLLEIKAEKHEKTKDKGNDRQYMVRESHTSFYRSVALPKQADEDNVHADFDNGVLKVTVPFKELPKPKRIAIGS